MIQAALPPSYFDIIGISYLASEMENRRVVEVVVNFSYSAGSSFFNWAVSIRFDVTDFQLTCLPSGLIAF